jgi:transcriptional regulator with XRE-family HTH domain
VKGLDVVEFRRRRNLSRQALADITGLSQGKIWRIENKGVIHSDERDALRLAGVIETDDTPAAPLPRPPAPVVSIAPVEVVEDAPPPEVDFDAALRTVAREYTHYFSNSELRAFKRCRRKWWLGWYRGLRPASESPVGVRQIGNRLHRALQMHYLPGTLGSPTVMLDALEREIMIDAGQLPAWTLPEVREQFTKEANLERIMLEGYLEWLTETGADSELDVISSETYIEAPLHEFNDEIAIIGKIDTRVRRRIDGVRMFIDHKSVGDFKGPVAMLALDEQMLHYHLLESLAEDAERCDGALYNMLRRVKRTAAAKPPFYERVEVRHNAHELANYRRRVVGEITDILAVREDLDAGVSHQTVAYPNPTRDCTWDCPFLAICPMVDDGSRVDGMIEEHFVVTDPLSYYVRDVLNE